MHILKMFTVMTPVFHWSQYLWLSWKLYSVLLNYTGLSCFREEECFLRLFRQEEALLPEGGAGTEG